METSRSSILISNKPKTQNRLPTLIHSCIHPKETLLHTLFSSSYRSRPNLCDEFGCNISMYSLRYQRYRLFELLLEEESLNLNYRAKDQQGNTILHYAIIYCENNIQLIEKLIEKYKQFFIEIDQRNNLGFTPLLFAAFCGRYDLVFILLTKTNASPFARDYIQHKNVFDYIHDDMKIKKQKSNCQSKHLRVQFQQSIPSEQYTYENLFENISSEIIQNHSEMLRSLIKERYISDYLPSDLLHLLHSRYTYIQPSKDIQTIYSINRRDNSKISVHNILNLYDPNPRPKIVPPIPIEIPTTKPSIRFKKLGVKITALNAFSRKKPTSRNR
ncbi:hypothetical protein I4U23_011951 [Adineta vaga]|nr:hypothetical protein I4U23_011951 [Adineta vaga]